MLVVIIVVVGVDAVVFFLWLDSVGDEIQPNEIDLSSWNCSTGRHDLKTEKPKETKRFHKIKKAEKNTQKQNPHD